MQKWYSFMYRDIESTPFIKKQEVVENQGSEKEVDQMLNISIVILKKYPALLWRNVRYIG